jgi:hypothetical protein
MRTRVQRHRFGDAKCPVGRSLGGRDVALFANEAAPFRKIDRVDAQPPVVRVRQRDAHRVAFHHVTDAGGDGSQEIAQLQVRDDGVVQIQQELEAFIAAPQLRVAAARRDVGG